MAPIFVKVSSKFEVSHFVEIFCLLSSLQTAAEIAGINVGNVSAPSVWANKMAIRQAKKKNMKAEDNVSLFMRIVFIV